MLFAIVGDTRISTAKTLGNHNSVWQFNPWTSQNVTLSSVTAGSAIVLFVEHNAASSQVISITSDSLGQQASYTFYAGTSVNAAQIAIDSFVLCNSAASAGTFTVTVGSSPSTPDAKFHLVEVKGAATSSCVRNEAHNGAGSGTITVSVAGTAGDFVTALGYLNSGITPPSSPWTTVEIDPSTVGASIYQIAPTTTTYSPVWTGASTYWVAQAFAIK